MTQEKIIACKDCKHHRRNIHCSSICARPVQNSFDYTTGKVARAWQPTASERIWGGCGHSAKFFEQKATLKEKVIQFFKKGNA
jgi:hypothetical protein